jgi:hypothetical protein
VGSVAKFGRYTRYGIKAMKIPTTDCGQTKVCDRTSNRPVVLRKVASSCLVRPSNASSEFVGCPAIPEQNKNGLKIATYGEIRNIFS